MCFHISMQRFKFLPHFTEQRDNDLKAFTKYTWKNTNHSTQGKQMAAGVNQTLILQHTSYHSDVANTILNHICCFHQHKLSFGNIGKNWHWNIYFFCIILQYKKIIHQMIWVIGVILQESKSAYVTEASYMRVNLTQHLKYAGKASMNGWMLIKWDHLLQTKV